MKTIEKNLTADEIVRRLKFCDNRWEQAMAHRNYRDEETIEKPFSDEEVLRYWWADTWRDLYHRYEDQLMEMKEIRHGLLEGLQGEEATVFTYEDD